MNEAMITEAVRAVQPSAAQGGADPTFASERVANPNAVSRFQAAMAAEGPQAPAQADPIPFASEAAATWRAAQANNQGILHRIRALSDLRETHSPSMVNLIELQYEVMNLTFQQEVVTKVADKASNAVQTLIKNQ